jgi:hypothetical protein
LAFLLRFSGWETLVTIFTSLQALEGSTPSASVRLLFATVLAKFQQSHGSFD